MAPAVWGTIRLIAVYQYRMRERQRRLRADLEIFERVARGSRQESNLLDEGRRELLFGDLARLQHAGIATQKAMAMMAEASEPRLASRVRRAAGQLARGRSLAEAFRFAGLADGAEAALIAAHAESGRPEIALQALAEMLGRRRQRRGRMRARLALPAAVFLLGCLLAPLPALIAQRIDAAAYLWRAMVPLLAAVLGGWLLVQLPRRLPAALLDALPLLGRGRRLAERERLFELLARLLQAGLPGDGALRAAANVLSPHRRAQVGVAAGLVAGGAPLTDTLADLGLLDRADDAPLLVAAEHAGELPAMLGRRAEALAALRAHRASIIDEWLPRLVYAGVAAYVVSGML